MNEQNEKKGTLLVKDLEQRDYLTWVDLSQDIEAIHEHIPESQRYDTFFVDIQDGEYVEVWGMYNTVPYLNKLVYRVI